VAEPVVEADNLLLVPVASASARAAVLEDLILPGSPVISRIARNVGQ
jgi:hypothetical protein